MTKVLHVVTIFLRGDQSGLTIHQPLIIYLSLVLVLRYERKHVGQVILRLLIPVLVNACIVRTVLTYLLQKVLLLFLGDRQLLVERLDLRLLQQHRVQHLMFFLTSPSDL